MRVRMRCPNCEQTLMVREEEVGKAGRCPMCKQAVTLVPVGPAPKPAAAATRPEGGSPAAPRPVAATRPQAAAAARPQGVATATRPQGVAAPAQPAIPLARVETRASAVRPAPPAAKGGTSDLALERLEDDVARRQLDVRGAIPVGGLGPRPHGKTRNPGLAFLLALVPPFYILYWFLETQKEITLHGRQPAPSPLRTALLGLLGLLTGTLFIWVYAPRRLTAFQSTCGDPNRVSAPGTLILGLIPVLGWAINVSAMQKALNRHWQWHASRGADSVTAGLAQ